LGVGEGENTLPYGIPQDEPVSRLEDGLRIIRSLWEADGPVSLESKYWPHDRAVLGLGSYADGTYPAIWVAGHGPRMLEITGRWADGWIPMLMSPSEYGFSLAQVHEARRNSGRRGSFEAAMWTFVCYGDSKAECQNLFESPMFRTLALLLPASVFESFGIPHPLGQRSNGLKSFVPTWLSAEEMLNAAMAVPPELVGRVVLHGSVDEIADELEGLHRAGCQTVCLANVSFLTDTARVRDSFLQQRELLKRYAVASPA
jgi:phthiodiolone/phenolphthiodiolone dimycocerosates ketoreductase